MGKPSIGKNYLAALMFKKPIFLYIKKMYKSAQKRAATQQEIYKGKEHLHNFVCMPMRKFLMHNKMPILTHAI